jgi:hypothetical protein
VLIQLAHTCSPLRLQPGEVIVSQGITPDGVYLLTRGECLVERELGISRENMSFAAVLRKHRVKALPIATLRAGEYCGDSCLLFSAAATAAASSVGSKQQRDESAHTASSTTVSCSRLNTAGASVLFIPVRIARMLVSKDRSVIARLEKVYAQRCTRRQHRVATFLDAFCGFYPSKELFESGASGRSHFDESLAKSQSMNYASAGKARCLYVHSKQQQAMLDSKSSSSSGGSSSSNNNKKRRQQLAKFLSDATDAGGDAANAVAAADGGGTGGDGDKNGDGGGGGDHSDHDGLSLYDHVQQTTERLVTVVNVADDINSASAASAAAAAPAAAIKSGSNGDVTSRSNSQTTAAHLLRANTQHGHIFPLPRSERPRSHRLKEADEKAAAAAASSSAATNVLVAELRHALKHSNALGNDVLPNVGMLELAALRLRDPVLLARTRHTIALDKFRRSQAHNVTDGFTATERWQFAIAMVRKQTRFSRWFGAKIDFDVR